MSLVNGIQIFQLPKEKTVLWDHKACGRSVILHISEHQKPKVYLKVKVIQSALARLEASKDGHKAFCQIRGSISSNTGAASVGISMSLNHLEDFNCSKCLEEGEIAAPVALVRKTKGEFLWDMNQYFADLKEINSSCRVMQSLDIAKFLKPRIICDFYGVQCDVKVEIAAVATSFTATPISAVPVLPSPLSQALCESEELVPSTGFLTMDQTKKLVLVSETELHLIDLPLVGIWAGGVSSVLHPIVWAACVRYVSSTLYKTRLCMPPLPFLLVAYHPETYLPTFHDVICESRNSWPIFACYEGTGYADMPKVPVLESKLLFVDLDMLHVNTQNPEFKQADSLIERSEIQKAPSVIASNTEDMPLPSHKPPETFRVLTDTTPLAPNLSFLCEPETGYLQGQSNTARLNSIHPSEQNVVPNFHTHNSGFSSFAQTKHDYSASNFDASRPKNPFVSCDRFGMNQQVMLPKPGAMSSGNDCIVCQRSENVHPYSGHCGAATCSSNNSHYNGNPALQRAPFFQDTHHPTFATDFIQASRNSYPEYSSNTQAKSLHFSNSITSSHVMCNSREMTENRTSFDIAHNHSLPSAPYFRNRDQDQRTFSIAPNAQISHSSSVPCNHADEQSTFPGPCQRLPTSENQNAGSGPQDVTVVAHTNAVSYSPSVSETSSHAEVPSSLLPATVMKPTTLPMKSCLKKPSVLKDKIETSIPASQKDKAKAPIGSNLPNSRNSLYSRESFTRVGNTAALKKPMAKTNVKSIPKILPKGKTAIPVRIQSSTAVPQNKEEKIDVALVEMIKAQNDVLATVQNKLSQLLQQQNSNSDVNSNLAMENHVNECLPQPTNIPNPQPAVQNSLTVNHNLVGNAPLQSSNIPITEQQEIITTEYPPMESITKHHGDFPVFHNGSDRRSSVVMPQDALAHNECHDATRDARLYAEFDKISSNNSPKFSGSLQPKPVFNNLCHKEIRSTATMTSFVLETAKHDYTNCLRDYWKPNGIVGCRDLKSDEVHGKKSKAPTQHLEKCCYGNFLSSSEDRNSKSCQANFANRGYHSAPRLHNVCLNQHKNSPIEVELEDFPDSLGSSDDDSDYNECIRYQHSYGSNGHHDNGSRVCEQRRFDNCGVEHPQCCTRSKHTYQEKHAASTQFGEQKQLKSPCCGNSTQRISILQQSCIITTENYQGNCNNHSTDTVTASGVSGRCDVRKPPGFSDLTYFGMSSQNATFATRHHLQKYGLLPSEEELQRMRDQKRFEPRSEGEPATVWAFEKHHRYPRNLESIL